MQSNTVVVLGSLHYDILIQSDKIPSIGETVIANRWYPKLGGKGANQAVALSKEVFNVKFVSAIGNDLFSEFLTAKLKEQKISLDYILKINGSSGMSVAISNKDGDYSAIVISGVNLKISNNIILRDKLWENTSFLMIQNEIPEEINISAVKEAKKRNVKVFLNAAPAKKINKKLYDFIDILLVNEIESKQIFEDNNKDFKYIAKELTKKVPRVIITLGSKGVVICEKNKLPEHINAHLVKVKSAHGAGDYFAGKFISEYIETNDFQKSVTIANKKTSEFISS